MLQLTPGTEQLVRRVAARLGREHDDLIRAVLEREAEVLGIAGTDDPPVRRRITAAEILAVGRSVAARPILDLRSPQEIADNLNGTDVERWR